MKPKFQVEPDGSFRRLDDGEEPSDFTNQVFKDGWYTLTYNVKGHPPMVTKQHLLYSMAAFMARPSPSNRSRLNTWLETYADEWVEEHITTDEVADHEAAMMLLNKLGNPGNDETADDN